MVPRDAAILNNIFYVKVPLAHQIYSAAPCAAEARGASAQCDDARLEHKVRESAEAAAAALKKQVRTPRAAVTAAASKSPSTVCPADKGIEGQKERAR